MRVIALSKLRAFWESGHALAEGPLKAWYSEAKRVHWARVADIKARYPGASIIDSETVVFDIHGNTYRLVLKVWFGCRSETDNKSRGNAACWKGNDIVDEGDLKLIRRC